MSDLLMRLDEAANDTHYIDHITAREAAARILALEAENARLRMMLDARGRFDAGEPSSPPTTGNAARPLVADWRVASRKTEDGYNG